jgi:predicted nicotinamide N-methyase
VVAGREFVLAHTRLQPAPLVPEVRLHLGAEITPLWEATERELGAVGVDPPFWAFAWAGGQALARYVLDRPEEVAGRTVLDLAAGSGLCAVAAMRAGASAALAADIGPFAGPAVAANAAANGVTVAFTGHDLLGGPPPAVDVVLAGDVFYVRRMAERVLGWLRAAASGGTRVLVGDPRRMFLPAQGLLPLAEYAVPTSRDLESATVTRTAVFALAPADHRAGPGACGS